jgi:hypothetical protein
MKKLLLLALCLPLSCTKSRGSLKTEAARHPKMQEMVEDLLSRAELESYAPFNLLPIKTECFKETVSFLDRENLTYAIAKKQADSIAIGNFNILNSDKPPMPQLEVYCSKIGDRLFIASSTIKEEGRVVLRLSKLYSVLKNKDNTYKLIHQSPYSLGITYD